MRRAFTVEIGGQKVHLGRHTLIMGVLNVTPDSFSDGGQYLSPERAIAHGLEIVSQGANWIDVGGESTRPGAQPVPAEEELLRVLPVIRGLRRRMSSLPISIDTTKSEVGEQAVQAGAGIINDISGLRFDPRLAEVARRHRTPLILMHIRRRPQTMQRGPFAKSVWRSLGRGLEWSIRQALSSGVHRSQLILDPGLGFGKTRRQNFEIVAQLRRLRRFGLPILVGASRKSFVQAVVAGEDLGARPLARRRPRATGRRLEPDVGKGWPLTCGARPSRPQPLDVGDAAMVVAAVLGGAHIVRVHDVASVLPAVRIADALLAAAD